MSRLVKHSLIAGMLALSASVFAEEQFITIGTGGQTGVYYVVGQSICQLMNRNTAKSGIKCNAPSTGASIANLNSIAAGEFQMGIVQSDWVYHAYNGSSRFAGKKNDKLRTVFSMYPEPYTLVVRQDAGIDSFDDLKGKRVNIGDPGSGTRSTMDVILDAKGWNLRDFAVASELKPAEMASAMCDNNLDAITYAVGHPNGAIKEASVSCASKVVPVQGEAIDKLIADFPYYDKAIIPGGMYKGTDQDVNTFGVFAMLVTSEDVSDDLVYEVVKTVFENFDRFKRLHPAFENLNEKDMTTKALSAPLHNGAIRYYKERGWM